MPQLIAYLLLLAGGIGVLYFGAEWLVRGSARLAVSLGLHPIVVGLTVVSLGTSAPELVVCLVAALRNEADVAMGNVMGSNLANIGLILGLTAVVRPLKVASRVVYREVPLMLVITMILYPLMWDNLLGRYEGVALLTVLLFYLVFVFRSGLKEEPEILGEYEDFARASEHMSPPGHPRRIVKDAGLIVAGCLALVLGGRAIVDSAVFLATAFGISQLTIGLTVIAVGTSLPELATSLIAALRREADIAVGNVIGSNIFNVAAILGITATVRPIRVNPSVLWQEFPAVLLLSFLVWPVTWSALTIRRWEGGVLFAVYIGLAGWLVTTGVVLP